MGDGTDRAGCLAGVTANANFRIDQVLLDQLDSGVHGGSIS